MKNRMLRQIVGAVLLIALLLFCSAVYAENIDPVNDAHQYAWDENVG